MPGQLGRDPVGKTRVQQQATDHIAMGVLFDSPAQTASAVNRHAV
jgi:hypothetical protein